MTLEIQHCECGTWTWPPQPCCPSCLALDPPLEAVEPRGRIFTWTRTHQPFLSDIEIPYVTVVVELPQAGGRRVVGVFDGEPEIGAEVTGAIRDGTLQWVIA